MGKGKSFVSGYWYKLGMHLGICHGPIDEMMEIRVGGRTAWAGSSTENERITIDQPNLFGGKKREGGIQGELDVMMGAADQEVNDYLETAQFGAIVSGESLQPAYRGFFGVVWRGGIVSANNPYVKPWSFLCKRIAAGWDGATWYSAKAAIDVSEVGTGALIAMNPAHIIYECITNSEWGMGYPSGTVDLASFAAAADIFHSEGFGLCIQWTRQESIENFITLVCDHVGAAVGQDLRTGKWRLIAIRDNYVIDTLPLLSSENGSVVALEDFDRGTPTESINELTILFSDILLAKKSTVTVHHLANITSQGSVVPQTQEYPGIPTATLAGRVAQRDLRMFGSSIAKARIIANRSAYGLLKGDPFRFSWPDLGIESMVMRVASIKYGTLENGRIEIEAVQDIFGLPETTYVTMPPVGWTPPDRTPIPTPNYAAFEVPYREIAAAEGAANAEAIPSTSGFIAGVARKPSSMSVSFDMRTRLGSAAYDEGGGASWTPTATLAASISRSATTITLSNAIDLTLVDGGTACMIGTEIVRVDTLNTIANTMTVGRGCADTVPQAWPSGTRVWFFDEWAAADQTEYVIGDVVDAKFVTITGSGELDESLAPSASVTINRRAARPYPPGRLRINGAEYPASISGALTVSWAHRDRVGQQDALIDTAALDIGPEPGTTYRLRLYDEAGVLRRTEVLTGTSYTWADEIVDSGGSYTEVVTGLTWSQSSVYSGLSATSANMRDDDNTTGAGTNTSAAEYVRVDLGSALSVGKIALRGGTITGWGPVAPYLNGAVIQYSLDGSTGWTTVATVSGISDTGPAVEFLFSAVTARYWQVKNSGYLATAEFRIYESGAAELNSQVRIRLESERDGLVSWQEHDITVPRV